MGQNGGFSRLEEDVVERQRFLNLQFRLRRWIWAQYTHRIVQAKRNRRNSARSALLSPESAGYDVHFRRTVAARGRFDPIHFCESLAQHSNVGRLLRTLQQFHDYRSIIFEHFRRKFEGRLREGHTPEMIGRRMTGEPDVPELDLSDGGGVWTTFKRWMGLQSAQEVAS